MLYIIVDDERSSLFNFKFTLYLYFVISFYRCIPIFDNDSSPFFFRCDVASDENVCRIDIVCII